MKHIDEIYKDWCGKSHIENSCHPVHDSAEAQDFAQYYHNEMLQANGDDLKNRQLTIPDVSGMLPANEDVYRFLKVMNKLDDGGLLRGFMIENKELFDQLRRLVLG